MWIDNKSDASPTVNLEWGDDKPSSASQSINRALRAGHAPFLTADLILEPGIGTCESPMGSHPFRPTSSLFAGPKNAPLLGNDRMRGRLKQICELAMQN